MARQEERLQIAVSTYIKYQYPDVIFTMESSGLRVPIGVAKKMKAQRSEKGLPDLIIAEPKGKYHSLFLELKKSETKIYKKDGSIYSDSHLFEQKQIIDRLKKKGFYADFAIGFDSAKEIIDKYMEEKL